MTTTNRHPNPKPVTLPQPPFELIPPPVEMTHASRVPVIGDSVRDDADGTLIEEDGSE